MVQLTRTISLSHPYSSISTKQALQDIDSYSDKTLSNVTHIKLEKKHLKFTLYIHLKSICLKYGFKFSANQ